MGLAALRSATQSVPLHRLTRLAGVADWSFETLRGRLVELDSTGGSPAVSAACALLYEAQSRREFGAWIHVEAAPPFAPDLAANGLDLSSLPFVHAASEIDAFRAASRLLQSDGFGLIVLDLPSKVPVPPAAVGRLAKLAQLHDALVLHVSPTRAGRLGLGSIVSLRMQGTCARRGPDAFVVELAASKDKRHGPHWTWQRTLHGTPGLY